MPDVIGNAWNSTIGTALLHPIDFLPEEVGDIVYPIAGSIIGGPAGAAAASGFRTGMKTGDPLAGLGAAAGSYIGSNLAGNILGDQLGTIGGTLNAGLGETAGNYVGNVLGPELAGSTISSALGGMYGADIGQSLLGSQNVGPNVSSSGPSAPEPFKATKEAELSLPGSLSGLSGLAPNQISSNIATQGVYGGGQGNEESNYFLNMINRRLVGDTGEVGDISQVNPIEKSYLSQLGVSGNDSMGLLESLSKKRGLAA